VLNYNSGCGHDSAHNLHLVYYLTQQNTMKITLTYVSNEDKISKNDKKYTACSIRCAELKNPEDDTKEMWINGFGNSETKSWDVGDVVDVELYDEEYNGKTSKKFKTIKKEDQLSGTLNEVIAKLKETIARVDALEGKAPVAPKATPAPKEEAPKEDVVVPGNPNATVEQKEEHVEKASIAW